MGCPPTGASSRPRRSSRCAPRRWCAFATAGRRSPTAPTRRPRSRWPASISSRRAISTRRSRSPRGSRPPRSARSKCAPAATSWSTAWRARPRARLADPFHSLEETTMRFMVMVKATQDSEAGVMPDEKLLADMGKFNEELVRAGIMLAGEGLQASSKGARVRFSGAKRTVIDGPFPETKELVAGFWIWKVKSKEEAIAWVKRCPNPMPGDSEIEIRQIFEAEDFGKEFTPEMRAAEA